MAQTKGTYLGGGVARARVQDWLVDPDTAIRRFDDFDGKIASADTESWNATIGTSFTVVHDTTLVGGKWVLTAPASGTGTGGQIQSWTPFFTPTDGKNCVFAVKGKVNVLTANYGAVFMGLQSAIGTGTTPVLACTNAGVASASIDVCGMAIKADGTLVSVVQNYTSSGTITTTATVSTLASLVADTEYELAFVINGVDSVDYYVNGVKVATVSGRVSGLQAIPDTAMVLELGVYGGSANGKAFTADWLLACCDR